MTAATADQVTASAAPVAAKAVAQSAPVPSARKALEEKKGGGGGVLIFLGAIVAAGAIAAGTFFYIKHQHAQHAAVASNNASAPDTVAQAVKSAAPGTTAAPAESVAEMDEIVPSVDTNGKPVKLVRRVHHTAGGGGATTPAPTGTIDPKLVANIPTGAGGGGNGDLAAEMKAAAGGGTGLGSAQQTDQGPKFSPGSVPQRPSQGQVAGAIGSVMGAARACLGSDEPVSHATLTFQSDGTVKSVSVTGFAAGKSQEGCIKGALSKAHVDPFAEATYPATISIRPN